MDGQTKKISSWLGAGSINIFGLPFSGKDTQGQILADLFGGVLIAGGDILRSHQDPKEIERIMAAGGIIPSDFYLDMVLPYLARPEFRDKPIFLSAVGRSHGEEHDVMKAAGDSGHPLKAVIFLQVPEEEVWRRFELTQVQHDRDNRSDDQREVLETRLKQFQDKTVPVIEFYRDRGLLIEVEGALSRNEVTSAVILGLAKRASK